MILKKGTIVFSAVGAIIMIALLTYHYGVPCEKYADVWMKGDNCAAYCDLFKITYSYQRINIPEYHDEFNDLNPSIELIQLYIYRDDVLVTNKTYVSLATPKYLWGLPDTNHTAWKWDEKIHRSCDCTILCLS